LKNFQEEEAKFVFLHKDYLGSILAITDEDGNRLEQRHYDAWGVLTHLKIGNNPVITQADKIATIQLLIDRGYTSHEHLLGVDLIHMNGRLYDPLLRRFLNADENIQDPYNTQNYNKYGYVLNNPLMYNDPSGEFLWVPFLLVVAKGALIGAAIGAASYVVNAVITNSWSWGGFAKSVFFGAVGGAFSAGIGEVFQMGSVVKALGEASFLVQSLAHGVSQGVLSVMQGSDFLSGAAAGFLGSLGATGWSSVLGTSGGAMIAFGALAGGVGAELTGGNFWQGAITGGIVAGLNHAMHSRGRTDERDNPPGKKNANKIKQGAKISKEIGASAEFIEAMDKSLKGNSKVLGKFGKVGGYLSAGGQIVYDGVEYMNGEISGYRFTFRMGSTATSTVVGMTVGTELGGPYGFVAGTVIGVGAGVTESAWDIWYPQFKSSVNSFYNTIINNIMQYH
jgi:RHS repeat-associated protein